MKHFISAATALISVAVVGCATAGRDDDCPRSAPPQNNRNELIVSLDELPPINFEVPPLCERREVGVVCRRSGHSVMFGLGASNIVERPSWVPELKELASQFPEVELRVHGVSSTAEDTNELRLATARARALTDLLRDAGIPANQITIDPPERRRPLPLHCVGIDGDASRVADVSVHGDVTTTSLPATAP